METLGIAMKEGKNNLQGEGIQQVTRALTYRMYIMTPNDHMSHDLSYFSGPRTSGAADRKIN